jgi:hypothetical protein
MRSQESPQARSGQGIGEAIRKVYPPDAACDERLDALIDRLKGMPVPDDQIDDMIGRLNGLPSTDNH